jgi:ArsR family transcriptional regulator
MPRGCGGPRRSRPRAERYFALHAKDWDELRSLHIAESEVEAAIARALASGRWAAGRYRHRHRRMLELFAATPKARVGIDRRPKCSASRG